MTIKLKGRKATVVICLLLYLLAFIPRSYKLFQTAIYGDEITWMVWSKELLYNIKNRNWEYLRKNVWWKDKSDVNAIGLPAVVIEGLSHIIFAGEGKYSLHWLNDIESVRLPMAILQSLTTPVIYLVGAFFLSEPVGLIAAITFAFSPIAIGVDRWFIHDGSLTLFTLLTTASFYYYHRKQKLSLLPGIFLALGILTKPLGVLPIIAWFSLIFFDRKHEGIKLAVLNLLIAFLLIDLIWPGSWVDPFDSIFNYFIYSLGAKSITISNFYLGKIVRDPGWTYYLFQLFARTPEVILVAFFGGIAFLYRKKHTIYTISTIVFSIVFLSVISLVPLKTTIRYVLPLLPWIYISAAYSLTEFLKIIHSNSLKNVFLGSYLTLSAVGLLYIPNYYLYYNFFVGGGNNASKIDMVSPCYGTKASLTYLDSNHISGTVTILGCQGPEKYYSSRVFTLDHQKADLVIVESAVEQKNPRLVNQVVVNRKLIKVVYESGVNTAKIYR